MAIYEAKQKMKFDKFLVKSIAESYGKFFLTFFREFYSYQKDSLSAFLIILFITS
jgi:hypothetical protein